MKACGPGFRFGRGLALAGLACAAPGSSQQENGLDRCISSAPEHRWGLPGAFREVSGLALTDDGRLLLHNDEQGIVGAFDYLTGRITATYRLGSTPPADDFEGIAVVGPRLYLMNSSGLLYETRVPPPGPADLVELPFQTRATGLGERCELEGFTGDAGAELLYLACKTPRDKSLEGSLTIFRWSIARNALATPDRITIPIDGIGTGKRRTRFNASAIDRDPRTGGFVALAGPQRAFAAWDSTGRVLAAMELSKDHRQPEGIVLTPNGAVIIADEGAKGAGTIAVYACGAQ